MLLRGKEQRRCARYFSVWGKCSGALLHAPGSAFSADTMQHNEGVIVIARSFCCAFVVLLRQKMCCDLLQMVRFKGCGFIFAAPF
jgi:hypothetical protein